MFMSVIIVPMNPYVKKEDGAQYFKNHKIGLIIMGITYTVLSLFFVVMLSGKVSSLSNLVNGAQQNALFGSLFLIGSIVVYLFMTLPLIFQKEYEQNFFKRLNKYSRGEMINVSQLIDQKRLALAVGLYILLLMVGLTFYIVPIISLTGN